MYRFLPNGTNLYSLSGIVAFIAMMLFNLFQFKRKRNVIGGFSQAIISISSNANKRFGTAIKYVFVLLETAVMAYMVDFVVGKCNRSFGEMVGTGANYFGLLFVIPFVWFLLSALLLISPLKQIDILVPSLPLHLTFAKLGCFCNGCCWGIPWEHGPYNYNYAHPGNQVPVQAIEAFLALIIFVFLLWYRKKAKTGTMYPMYMIAYCGTRFFSEFFKDDFPDVLGPFKMYHILCVIGFAIGIILFVLMSKFGDRISEFFEKFYAKIDAKIAIHKDEHQAEYDKERKKDEKKKHKEQEKKNKKLYAHSRKL